MSSSAPPPHPPPRATVISLSASATHSFSKPRAAAATLVPGLGVRGDAHAGATVRHLSRLPSDAPNLRQVHLMPEEVFAEVARPAAGRAAGGADGESDEEKEGEGFVVRPGDLGENVTTRGVDLHALPRGTRLRFVRRKGRGGREDGGGEEDEMGGTAVVELTGLRNPCHQIDKFQKGLLARVLKKDPATGKLVRRAGVMGIVSEGGEVRVGDSIDIEIPEGEFVELERV